MDYEAFDRLIGDAPLTPEQRPVINYSEFQTLASCEMRWLLHYLRREEETGERAGLHLGTLIHLGQDKWLTGQYADGVWLPPSWTDDINTGGKPGEERTLYLHDFDQELVEKALWLLGRYVKHYGLVPPSSWDVVSSEEWLRATGSGSVGGRSYDIVSRTDGLVRIDGKLWLREVKSYGSKQRLRYVHVDPQLVIYTMVAESVYGEQIHGVIYDGIYTYRWVPVKPTQQSLIEQAEADGQVWPTKAAAKAWAKATQEKHPGVERAPEESFDRLFLDIGPELRQAGAQYLIAAINRRETLTEHPHLAIPNIGNTCNGCGFRAQCWARLGDDEAEEFEVDLEGENEEPV